MDPFGNELAANELDLDMLDPLDYKFEYDWDVSNSCTTEDQQPSFGIDTRKFSYTWAF